MAMKIYKIYKNTLLDCSMMMSKMVMTMVMGLIILKEITLINKVPWQKIT